MPDDIIHAIIDEIETTAAVTDGDWTAGLAVQAAENPPPPVIDDDEAA